MRKKIVLLSCFSVLVVTCLMVGCAGMAAKPAESSFKTPVVTLNHVETAHHFGWWVYSKVEPTKGKAGSNCCGAPLDLAFIFDLENPNDFPVMLEDIKFSVALEEFTLNTVSAFDTQWIPPGKTNQVRVHAVFAPIPALKSLLVTGGFKLKEKGLSPWDALEKWWLGAQDFSYPIHVKEGAAVFKADGLTRVAGFSATFPE